MRLETKRVGAGIFLTALALVLGTARPAAGEAYGGAPAYTGPGRDSANSTTPFPGDPPRTGGIPGPASTGPGADGANSTTPFPGDSVFRLELRGAGGNVLRNAVVKLNGESYSADAKGIVTMYVEPKTPVVDVEISAPGHESMHKRLFAKPEHRNQQVTLEAEQAPGDANSTH